jgi:release factor glutamine methyltransferase
MLHWGEEYFKDHKIDSPRLVMELLLCDILNFKRIDLYLNYDRPLTKMELDNLHNYIILAVKSVPLQYILGKTQFMGLDLIIDKRALIPRPETEQLARIAIEFLENSISEPIKLLDIGTGSGCLAIAIAKHFKDTSRQYFVNAIDNSPESLKLAQENAEKYNLDNIEFNLVDILIEDISLAKYDCIVSNPPYIPINNYQSLDKQVREYEPKSALTDFSDGLTFYKRFSEIANTMQSNAMMVLEIEGENTEDIINLFKDFNFNIEIKKDFAGLDRIMILKK